MIDYIKAAKKGDKEALEKILVLIKPDLFKLAYIRVNNKEDINDVVQETMILIHANIHKLIFPKYFKTWMIRILINECHKANEKAKKYTGLSENVIENVPDNSIDINENLNREEFFKIISSIDKKYSDVIYLYYGMDLSVKEISKLLKLNINTTKSRLKKGRSLLKDLYERED